MKITARTTIVRNTPTGMFVLNPGESAECADELAAELIGNGSAGADDVDLSDGQAAAPTVLSAEEKAKVAKPKPAGRKPGPKPKAAKPAAAPAATEQKPAETGADKLDAPAA
jgi:hypothetical protein